VGTPKLACNALRSCLGSASGRSVSGSATIFAFHAPNSNRRKSRILDLTSPLYSILSNLFLRRTQRDSVIALLSKPQQSSDGTCATPVCTLWRAVIYFSNVCLLPRFPPAPSLCEFQTPVNNSQSQTLIASLQLQKVTGLAIRLTAISTLPPQAETACWEPRIFASYLQPCVARSVLIIVQVAEARVSALASNSAPWLAPSSLHYSHILSTPITLNPPSSHPMILRGLNHLAGKQTSYSTT
jgi:hypothetical protein